MKNKKYWLLTSLVTLLPILAGLLLWEKLPEQMPTHFGLDGTADGWNSRGFAVYGLPLTMLALHWALCAATRLDKQNRGHNRKVLDLVGLIFPAMSLLLAMVIYSLALGLELNMTRVMLPLLGIFFLLIGNWLPKIKQNTTLGIKLKWTLYNEENWNKTHRFGGFVWVAGGLVLVVLSFLPMSFLWLTVAVMVLMVALPTLYSWNLAKKQQRNGTYTESQISRDLKKHPMARVVSIVAVVLILSLTAVVMFTGRIDCTIADGTLTVEASYYEDLTIPLDAIASVEYRDAAPGGVREFGLGSAKLMLGVFTNAEFGTHTRYTYVGCDACIVLRSGDEVLVLNAENEPATKALYDAILLEVSR